MAEPPSKRPRLSGPNGESSTSGAPKRPTTRKRAPLACEECRARKRRCDGAVPICGGCTKRMTTCIYLADLQEKAWQQGMIQSLRNRLSELEEAEQHSQRQSQQLNDQETVPNDCEDCPTARENDAVVEHEPIPSADHGPSPQHTGREASPTAGTTDNAPDGPHPSILNDSDLDLNTWLYNDTEPTTCSRDPLYGGNGAVTVANALNTSQSPTLPLPRVLGHGLPVAAIPSTSPPWDDNAGDTQPHRSPSPLSHDHEPHSVERIERLRRPVGREISQGSLPPPIPSGLRTLSAVAGAVSAASQKCTCDRFLRTTQWTLPIRRQADDLVRLYFTRVHRTYAILHQPTFMRQYRHLWEPAPFDAQPSPYAANCLGLCKQKSLDKTFPAMVNVVFALASFFAPNPPEQNSARAEAFFNVTQQIDLLDVIDEEGGIELVQLLLLMGFYLQTTEKFSKCWNIAGLAIRMAQNMGLQLSPQDARRKGYSTLSPTQREAEMRVRVWYGCVLLDREISTLFGRTSMIRGDQLRLPLPEAIDDEYLCEDRGKRGSQPANCSSMVESYIETIKLYAILGQVLDRDESSYVARTLRPDTLPNGHTDAQSLLDLDTMIMEWRDSLPLHLQYDPTPSEGSPAIPLIPESPPPTGISAPALRLYVRFLHVRVLILRGALEHLFLKRRHIFKPTQAKTTRGVARVQDWMLSGIAAQCVLSADSLVRCLDTNIKTGLLAAWWYNVSYLHTCGSVLLMGQLCSLDDDLVNRESLTSSWELCLQTLSRYTSLSSIASNSFNLLQESARRFLGERDRPSVTMDVGPSQDRICAAANQPFGHPLNTLWGTGTDLPNSSQSATLVNSGGLSLLTSADPGLTSSVNLLDNCLQTELWDVDDPSGLGAFMPYLSQVAQLESLPQEFHEFDFNME